MIITNKLIENLKTPAGGWTRGTLRQLGVAWPPKKGWRQKIIGKEIPDYYFSENPNAETFFQFAEKK